MPRFSFADWVVPRVSQQQQKMRGTKQSNNTQIFRCLSRIADRSAILSVVGCPVQHSGPIPALWWIRWCVCQGDGKVLMVVNVSPADEHGPETLCRGSGFRTPPLLWCYSGIIQGNASKFGHIYFSAQSVIVTTIRNHVYISHCHGEFATGILSPNPCGLTGQNSSKSFPKANPLLVPSGSPKR